MHAFLYQLLWYVIISFYMPFLADLVRWLVGGTGWIFFQAEAFNEYLCLPFHAFFLASFLWPLCISVFFLLLGLCGLCTHCLWPSFRGMSNSGFIGSIPAFLLLTLIFLLFFFPVYSIVCSGVLPVHGIRHYSLACTLLLHPVSLLLHFCPALGTFCLSWACMRAWVVSGEWCPFHAGAACMAETFFPCHLFWESKHLCPLTIPVSGGL